ISGGDSRLMSKGRRESSAVHAIQDQTRKRFMFHSGFRCGWIKELGSFFLFKVKGVQFSHFSYHCKSALHNQRPPSSIDCTVAVI
ncbi:hypothetical protein Tco_1096250, partial [Tanacetum coccineum]